MRVPVAKNVGTAIDGVAFFFVPSPPEMRSMLSPDVGIDQAGCLSPLVSNMNPSANRCR